MIRVRTFFWALLSLLLIWGLVFFVTPTHWNSPSYELDIRSGLGLRQVAHQLVQKNILWEPWSFTWVARLLGRQTRLKAGSYQWTSAPTPWQLLSAITAGEGEGWEVTLIEGDTFAQVRQLLAHQSRLRQDTVGLSEGQIMARLGDGKQAAEGWFYPDTYVYSPGDSDWSILQRAHRAMQRHLHEIWRHHDPSLLLKDPYQALIMASLIEKETANSTERPRIAGVFFNRLRLGMRLQTDPAVIYGLGTRYDGHLHRRDLREDTPFNTYTRNGLPPTPIAIPGLASLQAAVNPLPVADLYFVARGNGTHQFSTTLSAHEAAVAHYQLKRSP